MTFDEHIGLAEDWLATIDAAPSAISLADRIAMVNAHTTIALAVFNHETMTKMYEAQATALAKLDDLRSPPLRQLRHEQTRLRHVQSRNRLRLLFSLQAPRTQTNKRSGREFSADAERGDGELDERILA